MGSTELVMKRRLTEDDLAQIKHLEEVCNRAEDINIKFNWSMMHQRDGTYVSDFCYYHEGCLVGYAPLDGSGGAFEVTAAVLPAYRRQGIFRRLFAAARQEAQNCGAGELLLVNYPASPAGMAAAERLDAVYKFSEYRMKAEAATLPPPMTSEIVLEEVAASNVPELSRVLALSFEGSRWNETEALLKEVEQENKRYFLARLGDAIIGQIGVIPEGEGVYIRAVGIIPDWRGRGHGRQLLATTVQKMRVEGCTQFELDVATDNRQALSLYQSCGFHETTVYGYSTVPLSATPR